MIFKALNRRHLETIRTFERLAVLGHQWRNMPKLRHVPKYFYSNYYKTSPKQKIQILRTGKRTIRVFFSNEFNENKNEKLQQLVDVLHF